MDQTSEPARFSQAFRRLAHVAGTSALWVEFTDGKVYMCCPFYDPDWVELSRPQVSPGAYFNQVLRMRPGFSSHPYTYWPDNLGAHAWLIRFLYPKQTA